MLSHLLSLFKIMSVIIKSAAFGASEQTFFRLLTRVVVKGRTKVFQLNSKRSRFLFAEQLWCIILSFPLSALPLLMWMLLHLSINDAVMCLAP